MLRRARCAGAASDATGRGMRAQSVTAVADTTEPIRPRTLPETVARPWVIALAVFAWLTALGALVPLDYDEAVYSIVARGMVKGHWPYRDLFDHKPPLVYVWYTAFGITHSVLAQRLFASVLIAVSVLVFARVSRRWLPPHDAWVALICYAALVCNPFIGASTSIEGYMLLPLIAAVLVESPLAAGALLGIAIMTKPVGLLFAPLLFERWRRASWQAVVGCAAVIGVVCAAYVPVWHDFWVANITFNREFSRQSVRALGYTGIMRTLFDVQPQAIAGVLPLVLAAVAGAFAVRRDGSRPLLWAACALAAVKANAIGGRTEYAHYYILLAPPAALLAPAGLRTLTARNAGIAALSISGAISISLIVIALGLAMRRPAPDASLVAAIERADGELYTIGVPAQIYVAVGRQPQRRLFFDNALLIHPGWREEALTGLEACPPSVLILPSAPPPWLEWTAPLRASYTARERVGAYDVLTDARVPCATTGRD